MQSGLSTIASCESTPRHMSMTKKSTANRLGAGSDAPGGFNIDLTPNMSDPANVRYMRHKRQESYSALMQILSAAATRRELQRLLEVCAAWRQVLPCTCADACLVVPVAVGCAGEERIDRVPAPGTG